jgi:hypothetical protein
MCCASGEIKRVIVLVQLYCCVFKFIVFVGDGWMALVPAHLAHLRFLGLQGCDRVCDKYIEELVAAVPELVVMNCEDKIVGGQSNKQLEQNLGPDWDCNIEEVYEVIRQWAVEG